jgi:hypothetical protein
VQRAGRRAQRYGVQDEESRTAGHAVEEGETACAAVQKLHALAPVRGVAPEFGKQDQTRSLVAQERVAQPKYQQFN